MKFAYVIVCLILSVSLFAANCSAAKSCKDCNGDQCVTKPVTPTYATPEFRTLTLQVPVYAEVLKAKPVAVVAIAPAKAAARVVQAVRDREHKPVVNAAQAIRERERRPVARLVEGIRERKPLRSLVFGRRR